MALHRYHPSYAKLNELVMRGQAQMIATPTVDTATTPTMVSVPAGQVAVITKIVGMCHGNRATSPNAIDNDNAGNKLLVFDENGDQTTNGLAFLAFTREDLLFENAQTPSWRSAVPSAPVVWEPQEPLVLPSRHVLKADMDSDMAGGCFACYGYMVDEDTARQLGFAAQSRDTTTGLSRSQTIGTMVTGETTNATLIAALAGFSIHITDIHVRMQAGSHAPTQVAHLYYGTSLLDFNTIMKFVSNNPSDMLEWKMSPNIYLPAGEGVFTARLNESLADTGARYSINVTFRYVPSADVPKDQWWSYNGNPNLPTPALPGEGTSQNYRTQSNTMSLYYAGRENASLTATATSPGVGKQHIVEGYAFSVQKDTTVLSDRLYFGLTTGSAGGDIGLASSGITTTNNLISPILSASSHDQAISLAVDGIQAACPHDDGLILIDMTSHGADGTTPEQADLDVDEFHCLVWGRTVETRTRYASSHYVGEAS